MQRGFEADEGYYIQNASAVAQKGELDLSIDPPPDLIVEVDINRSSMDKEPVFHSLGVPEVWRYKGDQLTILARTGTGYAQVPQSRVLPDLPIGRVVETLRQRTSVGETKLIREFRAWIRGKS